MEHDSVTTLRLVLALGCPGAFVERCRRAAPARVLVRESGFEDVAARILRWRPLAIVVPTELYALDEPAFDAVATRARAAIVPIPREDVSFEALRCVLHHAIVTALGLRQA